MPSRPLRILYHHRIAAADGMRVHVTELVKALRARGHLVQVVGPGGDEAEQSAGSPGRLERWAEDLRRLLPGAAYELLELAYNAPAYARLARVAKAFRPDVIYERYNLFLLAGLRLRAQRRIPLLLEVNSPLAAERTGVGGLSLQTLGRLCERSLWRGADAVLPVTNVLAEDLRRTRCGSSGVHVVPNGANLEKRRNPAARDAVYRTLGLPPKALVLGFVGFVRAWHGLDWAVRALPQLPEAVHLVVVGAGPDTGELAETARRLGVAHRVRLLGRVPHDEVTAYASAFDVALQTAATPYASPLKLFEYMALGVPVVAPDQPNIREVLADGENALLFRPHDHAAFKATLVRICADGDLRRRLGAAGRRTVEQRPFTWAHNAERIEALANDLITAREVRPPVTPRATVEQSVAT